MFLQRIKPSGWAVLGATGLAAAFAVADPAAQTLDQAAFDQLRSLDGRWEGELTTSKGSPVAVEFEVTSNGRTVLERQFAGSPHEMVTVYYLAYDRLQATHYCSAGNQPAFKLAADATPRDIRMDFAGGTGLDPATDSHVDGERIEIVGPDELRVEYRFRQGSAAPTREQLLLKRAAPVAAAAPAP